MNKKIYHLSTCDTCRRIIKEINVDNSFELQDIKSENISAEMLDKLEKEHGSYELLFNKRARKYRSEGLHQENLIDEDYRSLILKEYTFLKRPVVIIGEQSFIGNSKKVIEAIKDQLGLS